MAIKVVTATALRREEVVIGDESLIVLESETTRDRMRRILFEQVSSVLVSSRFPIWRTLIAAVLLGLPVFLLLLAPEAPTNYIAGALLLIFLIIVLRYARYRQTTVQVNYFGGTRKFRTISSPRRMRRFLAALRENVVRAQAAARAREAAVAPASAVPPPLPPMAETPPALATEPSP